MRQRRLRWLPVLGVLLALGACSLTQLAYNRLDLVARWHLSDYVSLDDDQERQFDAAFAELWDWHRRTELPQYAEQLRMLAAAVEQPLTQPVLERLLQRVQLRQAAVLDRVATLACSLAPSLTDAQVDELLAALAEARFEFSENEVEAPESQQRRDDERELLSQSRRWLGSLTAAQRKLISEWGAQHSLIAAQWLAAQQRWDAAVAARLAERDQADFCTRARPLITERPALWTAAERSAFTTSRLQWMALTEALSQTATAAQRKYLRKRLLALADDFEALARTPAKPGGT